MNTILKICRVGPLLGLITRWHLYRVSRHADAASRSVLPCERFRSLAQSGRSSQRLLSHGWHKRPPIGGFLEIVGWLPIPNSSYSEAKSPTVSGGHLKYSGLRRWRPETGFDLQVRGRRGSDNCWVLRHPLI